MAIILAISGIRPEAIDMAPVVEVIEAEPTVTGVECVLRPNRDTTTLTPNPINHHHTGYRESFGITICRTSCSPYLT